jgi:hypothetical protein
MVRKLFLVCAVAGASLFPVTTFAKDHDHHGDHHDADHHDHDHADHHDHHGHERHWYHGQWWNYGVGPCWQWTPVGYVWICG